MSEVTIGPIKKAPEGYTPHVPSTVKRRKDSAAVVSGIKKSASSRGGSSPAPAPISKPAPQAKPPASSPPPQAPAKPRQDVEYKPIKSMTPEQAAKEGYTYSGAAGWHRTPATKKNIALAQQDAQSRATALNQMKKEIVSAPGDSVWMHQGREINKYEADKILSKQQAEMKAHEDYLRGLENFRTNQTVNIASQNSSQKPIRNKVPNHLIISHGATDAEIAGEISKIGDAYKKGVTSPPLVQTGVPYRDTPKLSWCGEKSLKASEYFAKKGAEFAEKGTSRMTNPDAKSVVHGAYGAVGTVFSTVAGIPAAAEIAYKKGFRGSAESVVFGVEAQASQITETPNKRH